jgi:taurine--2-oxoglutarate transaminase
MAGQSLVVDKVASEMMKAGVAVSPWISHFVIAPPLIIEKSEIDFGVSVVDQALALADTYVEE